MHEMHEDMFCIHRILRIIHYNEPLMITIALVLALVEKPTTTWTWLNMLLKLTNVTSNPMKKGMRQQVHNQKLVSKILQSPTKDQPNW